MLSASLSTPEPVLKTGNWSQKIHIFQRGTGFSAAIHTNYTPNCPPESDPDRRRLYWRRHSPQNACQLPDWVVYGSSVGNDWLLQKQAIAANSVPGRGFNIALKTGVAACTVFCICITILQQLKFRAGSTRTTGTCALATDCLRPVDEPVAPRDCWLAKLGSLAPVRIPKFTWT